VTKMSEYRQKALLENATVTPELASCNIDSWQKLIAFYQKFSMPHWKWLMPLLTLVERIAESEYAGLFRGGQSIYHLIISTKEHHGLETDDHFVAVYMEKNRPMWIEYSIGYEVVACQTCDSGCDVWAVLETFLARLWYETKGEAYTKSADLL
jgi:hypothetical protein